MAEDRRVEGGGQVALGFLLGMGLHVLQIPLMLLLGTVTCVVIPDLCGIALFSMTLVGVSQLLYVVPAILWARRRGRTGLAKGMVVAAALTFVLNAACWGLLIGPGGMRL